MKNDPAINNPPQWAIEAAKTIKDERIPLDWYSDIAAIIARHAPQSPEPVEGQPSPLCDKHQHNLAQAAELDIGGSVCPICLLQQVKPQPPGAGATLSDVLAAGKRIAELEAEIAKLRQPSGSIRERAERAAQKICLQDSKEQPISRNKMRDIVLAMFADLNPEILELFTKALYAFSNWPLDPYTNVPWLRELGEPQHTGRKDAGTALAAARRLARHVLKIYQHTNED